MQKRQQERVKVVNSHSVSGVLFTWMVLILSFQVELYITKLGKELDIFELFFFLNIEATVKQWFTTVQ